MRRGRALRQSGFVAVGLFLAGIAFAGFDLARYGQYAGSIREVRARLDENPRDAAALVRLAALYRAASRPGAAAEAYRSALAVDPKNLIAHVNLGLLYYDVLDLDRAIYHLRNAVEIDPGSYDAHLTLGLALERQGDPAAAEPMLRRTFELAPGTPERSDAARNLARVLERLGRKFDAAEVLSGLMHETETASERERVAQRIARLRRESDASAPLLPEEAVEVRFRPWGGTIPVKALLNEKVPAAFLVDTGASYTTISSSLAHDLGIQDLAKRPRVRFRAASGDIDAPLVKIGSLRIHDAYVEDLTVAVCDTCGDGLIDGLLGLNFLQRFKVEIDGGSGKLLFRKTDSPFSLTPGPVRTPVP